MTRMLYPVTDAAEVLGIGRSTLYELIASGELHTLKIGRRTLLSEDELRRYVRALEDGPSQVSA